MGTAYLNGEWMELTEIRISPLDRGFLFGDGVYEVIPVHNRIPFFLGRHLDRLRGSLAEIGIKSPLDDSEWVQAVEKLVAAQDFATQAVYLQVTRGMAPRKHAFPENSAPTVFMMSSPMEPVSDRRTKIITGDDRRWLNCHIKSVALLGAVMAAQKAKEAGCDEIVLFRDGIVTECSASNVLVVKSGTLVSPQLDNRILPGITMAVTLDLAHKLGIATEERDIPEREFRDADEIWVTSSTRDITTCCELDGEHFGPSEPSDLFLRMCEAFDKLKGIRNPDL